MLIDILGRHGPWGKIPVGTRSKKDKILNEISRLDLKELFPEVVAVLKIFLTIPVTVASGERSFSQLNLIKSDIRSCMGQGRLNDLATLNMNWQVARKIDFSDIIKYFAKKGASADSSFF